MIFSFPERANTPLVRFVSLFVNPAFHVNENLGFAVFRVYDKMITKRVVGGVVGSASKGGIP